MTRINPQEFAAALEAEREQTLELLTANYQSCLDTASYLGQVQDQLLEHTRSIYGPLIEREKARAEQIQQHISTMTEAGPAVPAPAITPPDKGRRLRTVDGAAAK